MKFPKPIAAQGPGSVDRSPRPPVDDDDVSAEAWLAHCERMTAGLLLATPTTELTLSARPEHLQAPDITVTARQWAKCKVQTRMLMVRYSHRLSEAEARFAWGDR